MGIEEPIMRKSEGQHSRQRDCHVQRPCCEKAAGMPEEQQAGRRGWRIPKGRRSKGWR